MRPKDNISDEEIYNEIDDLLDKITEHSNPSYILQVRKIIFNRAQYLSDNPAKEFYKQDYLKYLLEYGYNEKHSWQDDGRYALKSFHTAIKIDPDIPIAKYRLGHIFFKMKDYSQAIYYFSRCLECTSVYERYNLEDTHVLTAKKMLSYAALKVFEQHSIEIDGHEKYPELNDLICRYSENNSEIINGEQVRFSENGGKDYSLISYDEYYDLLNESNALILDKYSEDPKICFYQKEKELEMYKIGLLIDLLEDKKSIVTPIHLEKHLEKEYDARKQEISRLTKTICDNFKVDREALGLRMENKKAVFKPKVKTLIFRRAQD